MGKKRGQVASLRKSLCFIVGFVVAVAINVMFRIYNGQIWPSAFQPPSVSLTQPGGAVAPPFRCPAQHPATPAAVSISSETKSCSTIHLALMMLGGNEEKIDMMHSAIKSVLLHRSCPIHFHFIVDEECLAAGFRSQVNDFLSNVPFVETTLYDPGDWPPPTDAVREMWTNYLDLSRPFEELRLRKAYLHELIVGTEKVIYMDNDILFLTDVKLLWAVFDQWSEAQILGAAPETNAIYLDTAEPWTTKLPLENQPWGFNTGIVLYHLDRMRTMDYSAVMCDAVTKVMKANGEDADIPRITSKLIWSDQDILNIWSIAHPEAVFTLPCGWNIQLDRLISHRHTSCAHHKAMVIHGNAGLFEAQHSGSISSDHWESYRSSISKLNDYNFMHIPFLPDQSQLVASTTRDYSDIQGQGGWQYGFEKSNGHGQWASDELALFTLLPAWKQHFFSHASNQKFTVPYELGFPYQTAVWNHTRLPHQFDSACDSYFELDICAHTFDTTLADLSWVALGNMPGYGSLSDEAYPIQLDAPEFENLARAQRLKHYDPTMYTRVEKWGVTELVSISRFGQSASLTYGTIRRWEVPAFYPRLVYTAEVFAGIESAGPYTAYSELPLCEDEFELRIIHYKSNPTRPSSVKTLEINVAPNRRSFERFFSHQLFDLEKGDYVDVKLRAVQVHLDCTELRLPVGLSIDFSTF